MRSRNPKEGYVYAIVETGGKQYTVANGQTVDVELLPAQEGETVQLDRVLLVSEDGRVLVGNPTVPGAKILATVVGQVRGEKIYVFKYKPKKRYRRLTGHRQNYTRLAIDKIEVSAS
jgi:large subunit ribosomal protein L21